MSDKPQGAHPAIRGDKILITGATGRVGLPVALALAGDNEVWAIARFGDAGARKRLESAGVRCVTVDLASGDFMAIPDDFTCVLDFAVAKTNDFDRDLAANVEGLGFLMEHCRGARAFLHCSSTAVYQADDHHAFVETDPLGDNHRVLPGMATYSIGKIAAEAMAGYGARRWGLPTTIARLNVPYGANGGWPANHLDMILRGTPIPVHADAPSVYNPIHQDDIFGQLPGLLAVAGVPATIVNWGGADRVSIEEWCGYLGGLVGVEPIFAPTVATLESVTVDVSKLHRLVGPSRVAWKDGFRRMVQERYPGQTRAVPTT